MFLSNELGGVMCDLTVDEEAVFNVLSSFDTNKAAGTDKASPSKLEVCSQQIKGSICVLINRSVTDGKPPEDWLKKSHLCSVKYTEKNYWDFVKTVLPME